MDGYEATCVIKDTKSKVLNHKTIVIAMKPIIMKDLDQKIREILT